MREMTLHSIYICEKEKIKKNNLPKSVYYLSENLRYEEYEDLWMFICRNGKRIDWGSSYFSGIKEELIPLIKGFIPRKRTIIKKIQDLPDKTEYGLVCVED